MTSESLPSNANESTTANAAAVTASAIGTTEEASVSRVDAESTADPTTTTVANVVPTIAPAVAALATANHEWQSASAADYLAPVAPGDALEAAQGEPAAADDEHHF